MRLILQLISWSTLAGIVAAALAFYCGAASIEGMESAMLVLTGLWFLATPLWMERRAK